MSHLSTVIPHTLIACSEIIKVIMDCHIALIITISSFADIRNWIRNIEQHASDNVNKVLVGNKADMDESKRVCNFYFFAYMKCGFFGLSSV